MLTRELLLRQLPPYRGESVEIHSNQSVGDIISEMVEAQKEFAPLYDKIALYFDADTVSGICGNIYNFCERNLYYKEESEADQTTAVPQSILIRGGDKDLGIDCKHFALFSAGIIAGINRLTGKNIKWEFRFASYIVTQRTPYHVFVVVRDGADEIWIDPTPGAAGKIPVWVINKKVNSTNMPLRRIVAGADSGDEVLELVEQFGDTSLEIPQELIAPLQVLLYYGVYSQTGVFDENRLTYLLNTLPDAEAQNVKNAAEAILVSSGAVGSFFGDIFKGVQHFAAGLGMQVPRAAFLGLVLKNVFGYATKLERALQYPDTEAKLGDLWERVGGKFSALKDAIHSGAKRPAVLKGTTVGEAATGAAAIIGSAAIIIAAIMPVITKMLGNKGAGVSDVPLDPVTGLPYGYETQSSLTTMLKNNLPIVVGALALLGYYFLSDDL